MAISSMFPIVGGTFHLLLLYLYISKTTYDYQPDTISTPEGGQYAMFQDVHVMIFIGFGFLMAFLKKYSFSTTAHSLYIAALSAVWGILAEGFWERVMKPDETDAERWGPIQISLDRLVNGDFAAGAVLITFGALVGRVSITQMAIVAVIEVSIFMLLLNIEVFKVRVADVGGSMVIHAFGAYFGLALSFVLEKLNPSRKDKDESLNGSTHDSDVTAMIGTLFLWCFWPSFNSYLGSVDGRANRIVSNTYLSLIASTLITFVLCVYVYNGKLRMVEVQNATLAGGVAIGSAADMAVGPGGAMLVGTIAGAVSVLGYRYLSPYLASAFNLKDTCGIHNLHAMPGFIGGVVSVIATAMATPEDYQNYKYVNFPVDAKDGIAVVWPNRAGGDVTASAQASLQATYLLIVLAVAIGGGAFTAAVISLLPVMEHMYDDDNEWEHEEEHGDAHGASGGCKHCIYAGQELEDAKVCVGDEELAIKH